MPTNILARKNDLNFGVIETVSPKLYVIDRINENVGITLFVSYDKMHAIEEFKKRGKDEPSTENDFNLDIYKI